MKKTKKFLIISSILLVIMGILVIHITYGGNTRKNYVIEYLEDRGYSTSDIKNIKAQHSFLNVILGYKGWSVQVEFNDEINVIYSYYYDNKTGVSQGSVSGGDANTKKENLKHIEK